jgi:hypothetical protein
MKIGLDFDGVIGHYAELKARAGKEYYGIDIPWQTFQRAYVVFQEGLLTEEEYVALLKRVCEDREPGLSLSPIKDAFSYIRELQKEHHVEVITARTPAGVSIVEEWLHLNSLSLPVTGVGQGVAKQEISKKEAAQHLDVFVDDSPSVLLPLIGAVPSLFLFSWPYNAHEEIPSEVQRVWSWDELFPILKSLPH